MSHVRWRQISSANLGFALPENILIPPVVLIASNHFRLPIADCQFENCSVFQLAIGNRKSAIVLAGAGGFEPTNAGSKDRCLTTWLRPSIFYLFCSFKRA